MIKNPRMAMKYKTHDAMHGPGCREAALPLGTSTTEGREGRKGPALPCAGHAGTAGPWC